MKQPSQQQIDAGVELLKAGKVGEAWTLAEELLKQFPESQQVLAFAADTASLRGDRSGAIELMGAAFERSGRQSLFLLRKAQLEFRDSRRTAALESARLVADSLDDDPMQYRALARIFSDCQDLDAARSLLLKGHEKFADNGALLFDLSVAEFHMNLPDEAEQHIATLLELEPFHPGALQLRSLMRTQSPESNHLGDLHQRLEQGPKHPLLHAYTFYALAKEHEDLEQYPESFAALQRGAQAYRTTLQYNSADELGSHADIRAGFTCERFEALPPGHDAEGPIFVIGMPRTGTTLVERLLNAHSQVTSIGEFTDFPALLQEEIVLASSRGATGSHVEVSLAADFAELGRRYEKAARELSAGANYFVDKLPFNFLYCGYIQAALPNAKLVHLVRDPLDTCYAVYKSLFSGAYSFSYDLEELADYFVSYHQHMRHWHEVMPGKILDVEYEQLAQSPEQEARRILDWCGLPWEEGVMEFHSQQSPSMTASAMQVRRPFYTDSIGNWQRAGSGFDPVKAKLEEAGLVAKAG